MHFIIVQVILLLLLLQSPTCLSNFGLASLDTLLTDSALENSILRDRILVSDNSIVASGVHHPRHGGGGTAPDTDLLCRRLGLSGWQRRVCQRSHDMADVLLEAVQLSVRECQFQFRFDRWNCSIDSHRKQILRNDFKETSFLHAISSAGLVHVVSRACSRGQLDLCTCDDRSFHQQANKNAWKWGGCGDNLHFGRKFARKILRKNSSMAAAAAAARLNTKTMRHNLEVGIKTVQKGFRSVCKCHGVSASCTTKTCWQQLAEFHSTGSQLKTKYESAVMVTENRASENRHLVTKSATSSSSSSSSSSSLPKRHQLVYTQDSPNFCAQSKFSPGTGSRRCEKNSSCNTLCCGRGYNVERTTVRQRCNCSVVWCCEVRCDVCTTQTELFTCK